ncbi:MAG: hypothetical protein M1827_005069 [Pycnora praestabilis]|nr:MAG: hypothetical protein M1827_005069 [Pycnora praestabilis]
MADVEIDRDSEISFRTLERSPSQPHATVGINHNAQAHDRNARNSEIPPTASPPPGRLTRKRAASLIIPEDSQYPDALATSTTISGLRSGENTSDLCLCAAERKVPRPRNSFILYRQHNSATVAKQHPGLANPDISKIIARQWNNESLDERNRWKIYAEEEKLRHQLQNPNYRYRPRRKGKTSSTSIAQPLTPSSSENPPRCTKCGKQSITTPGTPFTPFAQSTAYPGQYPPLTPSSASSRESRYLSLMNTPTAASSGSRQRNTGLQGGVGVLQLPSIRDQLDEEALTPLSPDAKRRRFSKGGYAPSGPGNVTPYPFARRRDSITRPGSIFSDSQTSMGPPPRPVQPVPLQTLPPLQVERGRSVEAMVMTIPYINKIKLLNKISLSLAPPGPTSPAKEIRGAIIAVDGADAQALIPIVSQLQDLLQRCNGHAVKAFEGPTTPFTTTSSDEEKNEDDHFVGYLRSITSWHARSSSIVKYITTIPTPPSPSPSKPHPSLASSSPPTHATEPKIPIALINRYQLSLSDTAATRIPINDSYSPFDHWQWMATLWRGIVGPDITIFVKEASAEEMAHYGGVEVRLVDAKAIVVRKEVGRAFEEKTMRRLGFEVGEWVRVMEKEGGLSLVDS